MKKRVLFPIFAVILISVFCFALSISNNNQENNEKNNVFIKYNSNVCRQVIRADGTIEPVECSSNLLYDNGKDMIRTYLSDTGSTDEIDWIELCNASSGAGCGDPQADNLETYNAIDSCGLQVAE
ncbi:unnamed protein product, partial [marine sediment metagenome]